MVLATGGTMTEKGVCARGNTPGQSRFVIDEDDENDNIATFSYDILKLKVPSAPFSENSCYIGVSRYQKAEVNRILRCWVKWGRIRKVKCGPETWYIPVAKLEGRP
jgi:hypothetical protein